MPLAGKLGLGRPGLKARPGCGAAGLPRSARARIEEDVRHRVEAAGQRGEGSVC